MFQEQEKNVKFLIEETQKLEIDDVFKAKHEAAHAIVAECFTNYSVYKITIIPNQNGDVGGYVSIDKKFPTSKSVDELISICISGFLGQNLDLIYNNIIYETIKNLKIKQIDKYIYSIFNMKGTQDDFQLTRKLLPEVLNQNKQKKEVYLGEKLLFLINIFREDNFKTKHTKLVNTLLEKKTLDRDQFLQTINNY